MKVHRVEFTDGPLDGHQLDVNGIVDQIVIVFRDKVLRYETDQEMHGYEEIDGEQAAVGVYQMVETRDKAEFDEELLEILNGG